MRSLLSQLASTAPTFLLFLKNVENIEIYDWPSFSDSPILSHTTSITTSRALRTRRSFVLSASLSRTPQANDYAMEIISSTPATEPVKQTWVVCNQLGGGRATVMANDPALSHMKLIPWSGVAALLPSPSTLPLTNGQAYCFLPLPVSTGLPVHVNGYFELSSNRRDVWWGDDMAGDGRARAEWNHALIHDIAAPSYARLVEQTVQKYPEYYEKLFPTADPAMKPLSQLWEILLDAFYEHVKNLPVLYSASTDKWVAPSDAVLASDPSDTPLLSILSVEVSISTGTLPTL